MTRRMEMMQVMMQLEGLGQVRRACGLTQQQLADALGVAGNTVWRWEAGYSVPSPRTMARLWKVLQKARKLSEQAGGIDAGKERSE